MAFVLSFGQLGQNINLSLWSNPWLAQILAAIRCKLFCELWHAKCAGGKAGGKESLFLTNSNANVKPKLTLVKP